MVLKWITTNQNNKNKDDVINSEKKLQSLGHVDYLNTVDRAGEMLFKEGGPDC